MNEEQEKKKARRAPVIGSLKDQFATFGSTNGDTVERLDSDTVETSIGETVKQLKRETASPLNRATAEPLSGETVKQLKRETVETFQGDTAPQLVSDKGTTLYSDTVSPSNSETVKAKKERKVSFYLTPEQESKLYDLEIACYQHYGKRINRNDIVRYLIEQCMFESLSGLMLPEARNND